MISQIYLFKCDSCPNFTEQDMGVLANHFAPMCPAIPEGWCVVYPSNGICEVRCPDHRSGTEN